VPIATQDFGQCLGQLLREKRVSASELARMMAYKSRNSIFRILDGEGGHGTRKAFFLRFKEENPLGLGEEALALLEESLEWSRVGAATYRSNLAMRDLIAGGETQAASVSLIARDGRSARTQLRDVIDAPRLEIAIAGCCDRRLMQALSEQLAQRRQKDGVHVAHFICTGQDEIVHVINAIQPMLYVPFYTAYCVEPGSFSKEREQLYRGNCAYICWEDEQGVWHDQPMLLVDRDLFYVLRGSKASEYSALRTLFEEDTEYLKALKTTFSSGTEPDYVAYTEMCRKLEKGRAIYTVKLDVPFPFIDPETLVSCALESLALAGGENEGAEQLIEALRVVHAGRFENIFSKHRPTHTIFSSEYMERFARTGRQTDHFFALRPYTGAERVRILRHILEQTRRNPAFNVYFFRPDFEPPLMEVTLYEGAGTLMAKPFTDYNLAGDHAEALVTNEKFCAGYKAFFTEDLLKRQVMTREETESELERLIAIAEQA